MEIEQINWIEENIQSKKEFSINVKNPDGLKLFLKEGKIEIHGREIPKNTIQQFQKGERFCIYSWSDSVICLEYKNDEDFFFLTDQTNYTTYINISQYLHELRLEAQENIKLGPRILVCGGKQSGKTTVVKIFTNYACKLGWKPILVDIDPDMNQILTSGCIGAGVCVGSYGQNMIENLDKVVMFHGFQKANIALLSNQIEALGNYTYKKLEKNMQTYQQKFNQFQILDDSQEIFASGCIINMPHIPSSAQQKNIIDNIIKNFRISIILCLEDELLQYLRQKYQIPIIKIQKPGGLKSREENEWLEDSNRFNQQILKQYFYGLNSDIRCQNVMKNLYDFTFYRIKNTEEKNSQQQQDFQPLQLEKVDLLKENLVKSIVGILNITTEQIEKVQGDDEILKLISQSTVSLLAHIQQINEQQREIHLLLPGLNIDEFIKNKIFIIGNITWH